MLDVVCGMRGKEKFKTTYKGKEYFFCSNHCKEEFEKNPEKFLIKEQGESERRESEQGESEHIHHHHNHHHHHHQHHINEFKKRFLITLPITTVLGFSHFFKIPNLLLIILSSVAFFYGGFPFLQGLKDEIKIKKPGMMTLIGIAISFLYIWSLKSKMAFELSSLISIMLLGHWIEAKSVLGTRKILEQITNLIPKKANLVKNGIKEVPISELKEGDIVLVRPGERIPSDGVVHEGSSYVDESFLTGEPISVKNKGDMVFGGSIVIDGAIYVEIKKTGKDTYISKILEIAEKASFERTRIQDIGDRFAMFLTFFAIFFGFFSFLFWLKSGFGVALERMVSVMVIACPHALGLAIPLVVAVSSQILAKNGILIRKRIAFEKMRNVNILVFDKTGTLTEGKFEVVDIHPKDEEFFKKVYALEKRSSHPIAKAITEFIEKKLDGIEEIKVENFRTIPGVGVEGFIDGEKIEIGRDKGEAEGTFAFVVKNGKQWGYIKLEDKIKKSSISAVEELKRRGIRVIMMTGDSRWSAEKVAKKLGVEYYAEMLPWEKAQKIKELKKEGTVAFVGDGINDSPAILSADVGIGIGSGVDITLLSSDLILLKSEPNDVLKIIDISRRTYTKMIQNLLWATFYNIFLIPLAGLGKFLSPHISAIIMSLSTVIVSFNAILLAKNNLLAKNKIKSNEKLNNGKN